MISAFDPILGPLAFEAESGCDARQNGDLGSEVSCAAAAQTAEHAIRAVLRGPVDEPKTVDLYLTQW